MHAPENVSWHKDLVYNAMWTLLVEMKKWNQLTHKNGTGRPTGANSNSGGGAIIHTVLMTGLGTGQGGNSVKRCAWQMILAVKHFLQQGLPAHHVRWEDVEERNAEIERTMGL
jgi:hypothetical protein